MHKTTLYLPEDLRRAVKAHAASRGVSEAEVIRDSIRQAVAVTRRLPEAGIFGGKEPVAERVDELLDGFGET